MNEEVPKYIQTAIYDLRDKIENLQSMTYVLISLIILIVSFSAYEKFTDTRYYDFGCVNVYFSSDFITYEFDKSYNTRLKENEISELDRTIIQKLSLREIYSLNQELRIIEEGACGEFLNYYFDKQ